MGRLDGRDAPCGPGSPPSRRDRQAATNRRLFEWRRAGAQICAGCARRRSARKSKSSDSHIANDRDHQFCPFRQTCGPDRLFSPVCEGRLARHSAGIQSVQVQFLSCQRRVAVAPGPAGRRLSFARSRPLFARNEARSPAPAGSSQISASRLLDAAPARPIEESQAPRRALEGVRRFHRSASALGSASMAKHAVKQDKTARDSVLIDLRPAGRRLAWRVHLGRARPASRRALAEDRGDLRHVRRRDERGRAGQRLHAGRRGGRAGGAGRLLEARRGSGASSARSSARRSIG